MRNTAPFLLFIVLLAAILVGLTAVNLRYAAQFPGGNDFLSRWVGTRMYFTQGVSPYSQQVTRAIQEMAYGRPARPGEDQMLFVYPLYVILIVGPFAFFSDYVVARALWMTALEVSLAALAFFGISLGRWRPSRWLFVVLLVFSLLWYHGLRPVINGNPSIVIAVLIAVMLLAVRAGYDSLAGFLLALSTIKPQMVVLFIPYTLIWAISRRRWSLVWSFFGGLALLLAGMSLLIPGWIVENLRQVISYPEYTLPGTPGAIFSSWLPGIGSQLGWAVTVISGGVLLWEWIRSLRSEFNTYLWTAFLTLTLTNLVGIPTTTENFTILLCAVILVLSVWDQRWGRLGRWLVFLSILLLFFGLWGLFLRTLQAGAQPLQDPVMFFPLPLFLWIGLYWVKWWAIHPPVVTLDELRRSTAGELV